MQRGLSLEAEQSTTASIMGSWRPGHRITDLRASMISAASTCSRWRTRSAAPPEKITPTAFVIYNNKDPVEKIHLYTGDIYILLSRPISGSKSTYSEIQVEAYKFCIAFGLKYILELRQMRLLYPPATNIQEFTFFFLKRMSTRQLR